MRKLPRCAEFGFNVRREVRTRTLMDTAPTPIGDFTRDADAAEDEEEEEQRLCTVCHDAFVAVRFWECGHAHTCARCTLRLIEQSRSSGLRGAGNRELFVRPFSSGGMSRNTSGRTPFRVPHLTCMAGRR